MATDKNTIKSWFEKDDRPTQAQFWAWIDSIWHKDEKIPITAIDDIETILNDKADADAFGNHLTDANAHAELFAEPNARLDDLEAKTDTENNWKTITGYSLNPATRVLTMDAGWEGIINGIDYTNAAAVPLPAITLAAAGYSRIDLIVFNTAGTFVIVPGIETVNTPVKPAKLTNTLEATFVTVSDGVVNVPVIPKPKAPVTSVNGMRGEVVLAAINDLVTGGIYDFLSAEQGKVLKTQIDNINILLASDNVNLDNVQELVDAIETVQTSLSTILVNDLTTGGTTKALTAEMGKTLKGLIDDLNGNKQTKLIAGSNITIDVSNPLAPIISATGGGGSVITEKNVYVSVSGNNSTGLIGREDKPFLTINSALDALGINGGIVNIGIGSFDSPLYSKIYPNTTFKGSGKPKLNNVVTGGSAYPLYTKTTATALIGGTILLGTFRFPLGDSLQAYDLGVDCGIDYCNAFNAGVALEGLMMSNDVTGNTTQVGKIMRKNVVLKNITTIVKGSADLVHSFCIENCYEPYVDNIDTYNGFAGFVYKNIGGTASNIKSSNSGSYGIIIKTNTYASNYSTLLNGFEIDGGAGLTICDEGDASGVQSVFVDNGRIRNTTYGVVQLGTLLKNIHISNVHVQSSSGLGFYFSNIQFSHIIACSAISCVGGGFKVEGINNRVSESRASNNTGVGIEIRTTSGTYPCISTGNDSNNNSTYGFLYSGDVKGGHNIAISNTTGSVSGTIVMIDTSSATIPVPLAVVGAPAGYASVLQVENTGSATVADKNVALFAGSRGSATNTDDNTAVIICQKNNTVKNYSVIGFLNSAFNTVAQIVVRNLSHGNSAGSIGFITSNSGALTLVAVFSSVGNFLLGKDEYTGSTNNDTGEKLQVVGSSSFSGVIKAGNVVRLKNYTVSALPVGTQGDTAYVTDATAPTYLGTLTGGGSVVCPVFYNGTVWVSH